jgi:predicted PurR-regulated permease PerM
VSQERPSGLVDRRGLWLLAAILAIVWLARSIIGPFIVAAVIAYAFTPLVSTVQRRTRLPKLAIVGIGYAIAIALLVVAVVVLGRKLLDELGTLSQRGPDSIALALREVLGRDDISVGGQTITVREIAHQLQAGVAAAIGSPSDALHLASLIGESILNAILALIVTFYFLLDGDRMGAFALRLAQPEGRARIAAVLAHIHIVLGRWIRGQLFLIALVALVVYLILGPVLHLPYALAIAILTGVLEVIPLVGPILATVIAGTDAFANGGPNLAITVVVIYFVLRQVEDQLVMPMVIGRAVHLHPVVTIFAVLVGLSTFGVLGGLLGVPVAAALNVTLHELYPPEMEPPEPEPPEREPPDVEPPDAEPPPPAPSAGLDAGVAVAAPPIDLGDVPP